jgi:hypothetical protein
MGYLISGGNVPFPVHKIDVTVSWYFNKIFMVLKIK